VGKWRDVKGGRGRRRSADVAVEFVDELSQLFVSISHVVTPVWLEKRKKNMVAVRPCETVFFPIRGHDEDALGPVLKLRGDESFTP
jgi:hypothetical protein